MIHILECSPNPKDATSYYRTRGVLSFLSKEYDDVKFSYIHQYYKATWADIIPFDVVLIQRPTTKLDLDFITLCKRMNKVVWIDYDDLHTDIPTSNPVYYVNPDGGKMMLKCSELADFITTSTEAIRQKLLPITNHVYVIKNAHNDYVYPINFIQKDGLTKRPKLVWRGGITHEADIYAYRNQMKALIEEYSFKMFGKVSYYMQRDLGLSDNDCIPGIPLEEYLNFMVQYNPAFLIYPLEDNAFNQAKSNIASLEALYSGGICIAPEGFEEFKDTSILSSNFKESVEMLMDAETFAKVRAMKVQNMLDKQVLSKTNKDRYTLLKHYTQHL